jgi:uncharacterized protein with LGFP repeats
VIVNGFEISNEILDKWQAMGGDRAPVGLPVANRRGDTFAQGKILYQEFQYGIIVLRYPSSSEADGPYAVWGDIYKRWVALGALSFGAPLNDEQAMPDGTGRFSEFMSPAPPHPKHIIVWSPGTGAWEILGTFRENWDSNGGAAGAYGYPTSGYDSGPGGGRTQAFVGGAIALHPVLGQVPLIGPVGQRYNLIGRHDAGYPMKPIAQLSATLGMVHLARGMQPAEAIGTIVMNAPTGAFALFGAIRARWLALGVMELPLLPKNPVGYPTADEVGAPDGQGFSQRFEHGEIVWHPDLEAFYVLDPIATRWRELGGEASGYPVTDQKEWKLDSVYTHFRPMHPPGGSDWTIVFHESTGAHPVRDAIRDKYAPIGWDIVIPLGESFDEYGFPFGAQQPTFDGVGIAQEFNRGTMCWHPEIGCFFVRGPIEQVWMIQDRERWGYPITDRTLTPGEDGHFQHFQAMHLPDRPQRSIYDSARTDPQPIEGPIRDRWAQGGWERSTLGYPRSGQYPIEGTPDLAQDFEHGRIVLFADQGAVFDPLILSQKMPSKWPAGFEGEMHVSFYADCRVRWHGHGYTSGLDNYDYYASAIVPLPSNTQLMFGFHHSGTVKGTLWPGERTDRWDEWGSDTILQHTDLRALQAATLQAEYDYDSSIVSTVKDVVGFAVKFVIGTGVSYFSGGAGLAIFGTAVTATVVGVARGSWGAGMRQANGILWMAGPHNTLVALGSELLVQAGEGADPIPQGVYDWMNEHVFDHSLPARDDITLTDTQGVNRRPFVFPRYDGQIMLNFNDDRFASLTQPRSLPTPPHQMNLTDLNLMASLAHELTHACQLQKWGAKRFISSGLATLPSQIGGSSYDYDTGHERLGDYTMEQQGKIVEDWVRGTHSPNSGRQLDMESPLYPYIVQMRAGMF